MRQSVEHEHETADRDGGSGFVIGAVLCAAVLAALFALHGGPDLLAGKLPTLAALSLPSP